jgi:hypothetical protein
LTQHQKLGVDETESIDDDLALDGLDRVNDDGDCTGVQLLEGLLSVDINRRQPATETRMRVVPSNY